MIRMAVEGCARNKIHSGLCGQAPSDYPDMAEYLVEIGIDSISLNPDTVIKTTQRILELERRLGIGTDGRPRQGDGGQRVPVGHDVTDQAPAIDPDDVADEAWALP